MPSSIRGGSTGTVCGSINDMEQTCAARTPACTHTFFTKRNGMESIPSVEHRLFQRWQFEWVHFGAFDVKVIFHSSEISQKKNSFRRAVCFVWVFWEREKGILSASAIGIRAKDGERSSQIRSDLLESSRSLCVEWPIKKVISSIVRGTINADYERIHQTGQARESLSD